VRLHLPYSASQSEQGHFTLSWLPLAEKASVGHDDVGLGSKQVDKQVDKQVGQENPPG